MIDGFKCSCVGLPAKVWQANKRLNFGLSVSESTGEMLTQRREACAGAIRFILSQQPDGVLLCSMYGSLHKHSNEAAINWNDFTFPDLCRTLHGLQSTYGVPLENTHIHALEIGVNIPLNYSPKRILKSAICHKGKPFDNMNKRDQHLGVICVHTDYEIKLYDKGGQARITDDNKYLLRYEVRLKRQRMLTPFGIRTFADLLCVEKVLPLICLLLERLSEIVFFDYTYKPDGLTDKQRLSWERYSNPKYWESLNHKQYYNARKLYAELVLKYGAKDGNRLLAGKVIMKWFELAKVKRKTLGQFPQILERIESTFSGTISELEYVVENVPCGDEKTNKKNQPVFDRKKKRFCVSCGRDISDQRNGSVFCSEKLYGKEAHRCRNKDSNRRLALKRKIARAKEKELNVKIIFAGKRCKKPPDKQAAAALSITRQWLNEVKQIEVIRPKRRKQKKNNH